MVSAQTSQEDSYSESCFSADTSKPLMDVTLGEILRNAAKLRPNHVALVDGHRGKQARRKWTYLQLLTDAERTAQHLLRDFKPGERVAVWASNQPEWIIILFGCALAGLITVTVNPAYKRRESEYILRKARVAGLFVMKNYRGYPISSEAKDLQSSLPDLRHIFDLDEFDLFLSEPSETSEYPLVNPMDPCVIMFTSGTTGAQKGVIFHHKGVINVTFFAQERAGLNASGVFINPMPMFHIGALGNAGIACVAHMATHVVVTHWDAELYLSLVEAEGGTYSLLVPTMIESILSCPTESQYNTSTLVAFMSGAAAVEPSLIERTKSQLGASISNCYGATETQGPICGVCQGDPEDVRTTTIGRPMPHIEMKIGDSETGEALPVGELGEIYTRGYQTMLGYYDMPDETAKTIAADDWLHSGDLGSMDSRGYFSIKGRIKDMIIRGGENIYPREIENFLCEHPQISSAVLVGLPDTYWGEVVVAVIIPTSIETTPDAELLRNYCKESLASFKVPVLWYVVAQFPMTETGKVQKFKLVEAIQAEELQPLH